MLGRRKRSRATLIEAHLNARLQPLDRGELFEDPLDEVLRGQLPLGGQVAGGGTLTSKDGEPLSCDIEVEWSGDAGAGVSLIISVLTERGAPRGSTVTVEGSEPVPFGTYEGVGLYLNGTDLPDEVYENSDVNVLVASLCDALGADGAMYSYWEGPTETALFFYGPSAAVIEEKVAPVLAAEPSAALARVVRLN